MTRRKLVGAAFFFTFFGTIAFLPPVVFLSSVEGRIFGVPAEAVYIFVLWTLLIIGGRWFSRALPNDEPQQEKQTDGPP